MKIIVDELPTIIPEDKREMPYFTNCLFEYLAKCKIMDNEVKCHLFDKHRCPFLEKKEV